MPSFFGSELDALPIHDVSGVPHASLVPGKGRMCGPDEKMDRLFDTVDVLITAGEVTEALDFETASPGFGFTTQPSHLSTVLWMAIKIDDLVPRRIETRRFHVREQPDTGILVRVFPSSAPAAAGVGEPDSPSLPPGDLPPPPALQHPAGSSCRGVSEAPLGAGARS